LNVLFDPDFEENHYIYLSRCIGLQETRLSRFRLEDLSKLASTEAEILSIEEPRAEEAWHRFGSMGFEEDGETLWVLHGDMYVDGLAQDPQHQAGSLLRILPNRTEAGSGYDPADGNAFSGDEGDESIYAYGLRSPWRGTRDRGEVRCVEREDELWQDVHGCGTHHVPARSRGSSDARVSEGEREGARSGSRSGTRR
jgi:glucose/arabinose dehydrogenase